ncbi:hypothetical protein ACFL0Z_00035 [Patescibacteria group bacterium]
MKEFSIFIVVVLVLVFAAIVFMGSEEFGDFEELSASLEEQVESVHK